MERVHSKGIRANLRIHLMCYESDFVSSFLICLHLDQSLQVTFKSYLQNIIIDRH